MSSILDILRKKKQEFLGEVNQHLVNPIRNDFNQAKSFVQQNPTPLAALKQPAQQVSNFVKQAPQVIQPIKSFVQNNPTPSSYLTKVAPKVMSPINAISDFVNPIPKAVRTINNAPQFKAGLTDTGANIENMGVRATKFIANNNLVKNTVPGQIAKVINPAMNFVSNKLQDYSNSVPQPQNFQDKAQRFVGQNAPYLAIPMGEGADLGSTALRGLSKATPDLVDAARLAQAAKTAKLLEVGANTGKNALIGAGFGGSQAYGEGKNIKDVLKSAGTGAGMAAGLGLAGEGLGAVVNKIGEKINLVKAISSIKDPETRIRYNKEMGMGKSKPGFFALPKSPQLNTPVENLAGNPQSSLESISSRPFDANLPQTDQIVKDTNSIISGTSPTGKKLVSRMSDSGRYPEKLKSMLSGEYVPIDNKTTIKDAKALVFHDPVNAELRALNPQNATDQAIGMELFNRYMDEGNVSRANGILNATSGTNEGQMIQILSQYDQSSPSGAVKMAKNIIKNYNESNPNNTLNLTDDQIKGFYSQAKTVQEMAQGKDRSLATKKLFDDINKLVPSKIQDKAIAIWKAGLLTSPRTTLRNLLGNTIHGGAEILKDLPATLVDQILGAKTGKRTLTFTTKGLVSGAKKGLTAAGDVMKYGFDPEEAISKYDIKKINWGESGLGKSLGKYTDFVFNSLGAQDKPFYHSAFARSLYDQAGAISKNTGKSIEEIVAKPTDQMLKVATQDASVATFKDKNALGKWASNAKKALGNNRWIAEIVAPFTGVPTSIAGQMMAYSPVGLVKGAIDATKVLAGKMPELQRQAAQEIGRGVIGTGLIGIGAYLSAKGLMTGNPKDSKEYDQWQLEGKQANSVLINGKWRSIGSIGPELLVTLAGAQAQQDLTSGKGAGVLAGNIGKTIVNQSSLQGVQTNLNAISNPTQYGKQTIQGFVGSTIPNIVNDTSKALDPKQREINGNFVQPIQSRLPIVRNSLLPKRDALSNEMAQSPTGINAYIDLFNSKTPVKNPVVNELSRLNLVGENTVPSKLAPDQTVYGQKVKLTPQELDSLEQQSGGMVTKVINSIISDPGYKNLDDKEKSKMITSAVGDVKGEAKNTLATGGKVDSSSIVGKYKTQLQKDQFSNGDKNFQILDGKVFRKDSTGTVTVQTQDAYNSSLYKAQMSSYKKNDNLKSWLSTADKQFAALTNQLKDPNVDELDKINIQNDIDTLVSDYNKFKGYGGFTKGSTKKATISDPKIAYRTLVRKPTVATSSAQTVGRVNAPQGSRITAAKLRSLR